MATRPKAGRRSLCSSSKTNAPRDVGFGYAGCSVLASIGTPGPGRRLVRIVIADDHPLVREGTAAVLARRADIEIVAAANDGRSALRLVAELRPDVLLLDLGLPDLTGIEVARRMRSSWPAVAVIVLTGYGTQRHAPLLTQLGVAGLVHKTAPHDELLDAIYKAADGHRLVGATSRARPGDRGVWEPLTVREHEVLGLMAAGRRNAEIASELSVTLNTVEFHVRHVLAKLDVRSRTEAVLKARTLGYVVPDNVAESDL